MKLVERFRDAITQYQVSEDWFVVSNTTYTVGQVSQQQAIYDQITNLTVRTFPLVFILCTDDRSYYQVFFQHPLEASRGSVDQWACRDIWLTLEQKSTPLKDKLVSAMERLDRLRLQDDGLWDGDRHEQRAKLFEWVFGINYNLSSRSPSTSTLRSISDTGNVLYNRMITEDYKESQDDIQAVSGIAQDIRDALLDYQVCSDKLYATGVQLKLGHFDRWHSNRRYTARTAS